MSKHIVVGISGASGVIYGVRLLGILRDLGYETHLVISQAARLNIRIETTHTPEEVASMADARYDSTDMAAAVASGSFLTEAMVVIPCTIKTLSAKPSEKCWITLESNITCFHVGGRTLKRTIINSHARTSWNRILVGPC